MTIELVPLKGVVIDSKEINFNDNTDKIIESLGEPEYRQESDKTIKLFYYSNELRFDINKENNKLEFIEFLGGYEGKLKPILYGVNVFSTLADELVNIIEKHDMNVLSEDDISKVFINSSISLWRELTPTIYENEIKASDYSNEEIEAFKQRALRWERVGIGYKGYFDYLNKKI